MKYILLQLLLVLVISALVILALPLTGEGRFGGIAAILAAFYMGWAVASYTAIKVKEIFNTFSE